MNLLSYRRPALEVIFIAAEGIAWFIVLAVLATLLERSFLDTVADRLQLDLGVAGMEQRATAERVLVDLRAAAEGRESGLSVLVVIAAAAGGFLLMRFVPRLDLGAGISSAVLVAATILGVNVLLHLAVGDLRIWDASRLARLLNDPSSQIGSSVDLEAFVLDPDIEGPHAAALTVMFLGLIVVWFRFMLAARAPVRMDRMARSFTVSFIAVFVALFVARVGDVSVAGEYAVPQFVLGLLGLAVANHERAVPADTEVEDRTTPWLTSVGGTLGLLLASVGVIGLLAYLRFGEVLSTAGDLLLVVIEIVAIIVVTPIYWIVANLMTAAIALITAIFGGSGELPEILRQPLTPADLGLDETEQGEGGIPAWIIDSVKFFAFIAVVYAMYWVGRRILASRRPEPEPVLEQRERRTGGATLGSLLSDLLTFRRRPDPDRWMNAQPVYRLFHRALGVSADRGLTMLPSETPDEFARTAIVQLSAPPVADAARMFERARFGRHLPSDEELDHASQALEQWDRSNPATEELRERIRGHRPASETDIVRLRLSRAKRGLNPTDESVLRGE